jgi:hypothetical protein
MVAPTWCPLTPLPGCWLPPRPAEGSYIIPKTWNFQSYEITGSGTSDVKTVAWAGILIPK